MAYWLLKSEPFVFSIQDLEKRGPTGWDGVRNYLARNHMKAMKKGDLALFYHSRVEPPHAAGVMKVTREAYPDPTQFDPKSDYYDPKATPAAPRWFHVEVAHVRTFKTPLSGAEMKKEPALKGMLLFSHSRLSVQPVKDAEWERVMELRP